MPFYLEMSKNITKQRDIYDTVIFRFLQIFYGLCIYLWIFYIYIYIYIYETYMNSTCRIYIAQSTLFLENI